MEVTYRNEPRDLRLGVRTLSWSEQLLARGYDMWLCVLIGLVPGIAWLIGQGEWQAIGRTAVIAAVALAILVILYRRAARKRFAELKEVTLRLEPGWLDAQSATSWSRRRWDSILQVSAVGGGVVIGIEHWMWHIVPARAFADAQQSQQFAELAMRYYDESRRNPPAIPLLLPSGFEIPPLLSHVKYQPTREDLRKAYRIGSAKAARSQSSKSVSPRRFGCILGVIVAMVAVAVLRSPRANAAPTPIGPALLIFVSCFVIWAGGLLLIQRLRIRRAVLNKSLQEEVLTLTISGCLLQNSGRISFLHWADVSSILQDDTVILFQLNVRAVHVVPKRAFASAGECQEFYDRCLEYWSLTKSKPADSTAVSAQVIDTGNPYQSPNQP